MSNLIIEDNLLRKVRIYKLLKGQQKIHDDYGLWICLGKAGCTSVAHHDPIPRSFEFYNISHMWKGRGWFWTPKEGRNNFNAGYGVMLQPGLTHDYNGYDSYTEDFICFTGPLADRMARSGIITPGIKKIGPLRLLPPIIEMASNPSRDSQIKANIALQNILVKLYFENLHDEKKSSSNDAIENLIQEIISTPSKWWTVSEMAETVNLSINQFIKVFTKQTGLTPKKYIDTLKIKLAAETLHNSSENLAQLAARLGYRDPFHFSKRFKEITGFSPANYRQQGKCPFKTV
ncbi:MAG: hypothetical protein A2020_07680 [Lentisphaerae bacterium GWF2_45_14]|nr:MAG: hypothetical protein A2020_07680 [Lentisphaerae bacterium GWF2_45_14]